VNGLSPAGVARVFLASLAGETGPLYRPDAVVKFDDEEALRIAAGHGWGPPSRFAECAHCGDPTGEHCTRCGQCSCGGTCDHCGKPRCDRACACLKFGGIWISDDRTELAVEVTDQNGNTEIVTLEVCPDQEGDPRPLVNGICVQPEALERGWTYIPTGRPT
jgi:hypothetical protein